MPAKRVGDGGHKTPISVKPDRLRTGDGRIESNGTVTCLTSVSRRPTSGQLQLNFVRDVGPDFRKLESVRAYLGRNSGFQFLIHTSQFYESPLASKSQKNYNII